MSLFTSENDFYFFTVLLLGIGIFIKNLELIAISKTFNRRNINDWLIVGSDKLIVSPVSSFFQEIYSAKGIKVLCGLMMILLIGLPLFYQELLLFKVCFIIIFFCQALIYYRQSYGGDGADQMNFLILITTFFCFIITDVREIKIIGLIFIAAQLLLSYVIAGGAKLISHQWRNGIAIRGILSSYTYGTSFTRNLFKNRLWLCKFVGWLIILIEILLPATIFFNETVFYLGFTIGLTLHISIAFLMGLNDFVWSFSAAYPSLYYLYQLLHV